MIKIKIYMICVLLTAFIAVSAQTRQQKTLWNYASPQSDMIIYFNTKQAEKAMDPKLWQRIQKDKNQALKENADDLIFDMKGRDIEGLVNVYIRSVVPLNMSLDGVANISGNIQKDIDKLSKYCSANNIQGQTIRRKSQKFYQYTIPGNENSQSTRFTFSVAENGILHFQVAVNSSDDVQVSLNTVNTTGKATLVSGLAAEELSFAFALATQKFITIPIFSSPDSRIGKIFQKFDTVTITGRIHAEDLLVMIKLKCKNPQDVNILLDTIKKGLRQILAGIGTNAQNLSAKTEDTDLLIECRINIANFWNLVSRATNQTQNNSPQ